MGIMWGMSQTGLIIRFMSTMGAVIGGKVGPLKTKNNFNVRIQGVSCLVMNSNT
jgi:hypothetical protein